MCISSRTCGWQCLLALVFLLVVATSAALLVFFPRKSTIANPSSLEEVAVPGHEEVPPPLPAPRALLHNVPSVMMELYHRGPHSQLQAEIVRSVTPRTIDRLHHRKPSGRVWEHLHMLTFDLPGVVSGETLHSAQLRLTLTFLDTSLRPLTDVESTVRIYLTSEIEEAVLSQLIRDPALEKKVTFNCTNLLHQFQMHGKSKGGEVQLLVGVSLTAPDEVHTILSRDLDNQPLLLLLYSPSHPEASDKQRNLSATRVRQKRDTQKEVEDYEETNQNVSASGVRQRRDAQKEVEDYEEETNQVWAGSRNSRPKKPQIMNYTQKKVEETNQVWAGSRNSRPKKPQIMNYTQKKVEETNQVWTGSRNSRPRRPRIMCRRRPLYVEFSDINYDTWIVAPSGYQAYQCVGKCMYPLSDHLSPTKHAIIQTLMHGVQSTKIARACCVPTSLSSISILYMDSQGVLTYRLSYKEMVVAECGCR